ncbi:hypothetical protein SETIT_9G132000v2 [Setaria italica]|uniref:SKP1 component POZ domain-containing protein n=1 Tax=Setaria italica TaxID=4555 RepID=A0A368SG78_SETIT|nr:hypothetical protein SETIT_9G132000v2 [Setaria italica]
MEAASPLPGDSSVVAASWDEDGKGKVRLLGCERKVFQVDTTVIDDLAAPGEDDAKKFKFKSWDGVVFEVDRAVAMQSLTFGNLICDDPTGDSVVPLVLELGSKVLGRVMEYCEKHARRGGARGVGCGFHQGRPDHATPLLT